MNKAGFIFCVVSLFLATAVSKGYSQNQVVYPNELTQLHQNIWENIISNQPDVTEVEKLLASLTEQGSWEYIDYTSKQRGGWQPNEHNVNILQMAIAYQTRGSKFYQQKEVSKKIHKALNFWLENDFQCPNWWYPEIGIPKVLAPVLILIEDELSTKQMQKGINILDRAKIRMTGQNKVWLSGNVLMRSLLLKDTETIKKAADSIKEELVVGTGEGVQPDWSYHQHGPQLQFGNYGLAYVDDMIKWISILRETPFRFDELKMSILRNYMLNGQQWVTWKNRYDISACGRQLFVDSPKQKAASLANEFTKMEKLDTDYADVYNAANNYESLSGNRHFWCSDFQVQRNPNYYFSVKMCSERVVGAESCNSENIRGYYMGDGATYLYQTTQEYENIFPFWDWKKIPGTTIHQSNDTLPVLTARGYHIPSNFVGGVSNGQNGVAVMDYIRNGLTARKSWFMFDDMIVCLGAGINSSEGFPVTTSVNQSYLNGDVIIKTADGEKRATPQQVVSNPLWILHDNIGYLFPNGGILVLEAKSVEGSWNRVALRYPDKKIYADVFKLWFEHGQNPQYKSYEYILVPNAGKEQMEQLEKQSPFVILNSKEKQEVVTTTGDEAGMVFYKAGESEMFGGLEVDKPCVVMVKEQKGGLQLPVAEPTQLLDEITIRLNGSFSGENAKTQNGKTEIKVLLPKEGNAGETVSLVLKKM